MCRLLPVSYEVFIYVIRTDAPTRHLPVTCTVRINTGALCHRACCFGCLCVNLAPTCTVRIPRSCCRSLCIQCTRPACRRSVVAQVHDFDVDISCHRCAHCCIRGVPSPSLVGESNMQLSHIECTASLISAKCFTPQRPALVFCVIHNI